MSDQPVSLVVNCAAYLADKLQQEADSAGLQAAAPDTDTELWLRRQAALLAEVDKLSASEGLTPDTPSLERVDFDAAALEQHDTDRDAAVVDQAAAEAVQSDRDALVSKLQSGKASPAEVQAVLARLLG